MILYEITAEISNAIERYNEAETQEQLDLITQHLESLTIPFKQKAIATARHIINVESDMEAIQSEIDRLKANLDRINKQNEWFRNYLSNAMLATHTDKIEEAGIKLSFKKSEETVILDEALVPEKYKKTNMVVTVDKRMIKEDWHNGVGVSGAEVKSKKNLQIK